jgi:hypothetical protein
MTSVGEFFPPSLLPGNLHAAAFKNFPGNSIHFFQHSVNKKKASSVFLALIFTGRYWLTTEHLSVVIKRESRVNRELSP